MGRPKSYDNAAEKQKAYRLRKLGEIGVEPGVKVEQEVEGEREFIPGVTKSPTDTFFEEDRPGYYIFGKEEVERRCWKCGESFATRMELNKFCSPECKDGYLDEAFGKLRAEK